MNERLATFAFAALALAAFYTFFLGPTRDTGEEHSRPLSMETRPNGYLALRRWLELEGIAVSELRHRFDWLERAPELPPRGNLLVTTIPFKREARRSELGALRDWVKHGNALLVVAGLFDTPEWAVPESDTFGQLRSVSGLDFWFAGGDDEEDEATDDAADEAPVLQQIQRLAEPKQGALLTIAEHPLTRGIESVHAVSEYPAGVFEPISPLDTPMLVLMRDRDSGHGALWLTWRGEGAVLVTGYGSLFTNKVLAQADNAGLFANVAAQLLAPGGHVIFDDMHQGAASFYDAEVFFSDSRLHASFWWFIGLWFVWVLGSTRLPVPAVAAAPVRERAFVNATGNLFARVLDRRRVARRLFANFFNEYRQALGEERNGEPLWEWLRANGAVQPQGVERLEQLHARVAAGRRVDLVDLHNRLQQLRKQIQ